MSCGSLDFGGRSKCSAGEHTTMRFLFISKDGSGLAVAHRVLLEGNDVTVWIQASEARGSGDGFVPKVPHWRVGLRDEPAVVVFDMVGFGTIAEELVERGVKVVGGGMVNDRLELDRAFGTNVMRAVGIRVPFTRTFDAFADGIAWAKRRQQPLVFKPSGNLPTATTYVSQGPDDLVPMMEHFERRFGAQALPFELQEIVRGVEVSFEIWFDGERFVRPFNSTIERKRLMNDEKGPQTGCMGNVVWFYDEDRPKMFRLTLEKLEPFLRAQHYVGPLDINTIIDERSLIPTGLEFTARFGYAAIQAMMTGLAQDVGKLLWRVAHGQRGGIDVKSGFFSAVRVVIPPYPRAPTKEDSIEGIPVLGTADNWLRYHIQSVRMREDGLVEASGADGHLLDVSGSGSTVEDAFHDAYAWTRALTIPDAMYRTDLGRQATMIYRRLQEWRFAPRLTSTPPPTGRPSTPAAGPPSPARTVPGALPPTVAGQRGASTVAVASATVETQQQEAGPLGE